MTVSQNGLPAVLWFSFLKKVRGRPDEDNLNCQSSFSETKMCGHYVMAIFIQVNMMPNQSPLDKEHILYFFKCSVAMRICARTGMGFMLKLHAVCKTNRLQ